MPVPARLATCTLCLMFAMFVCKSVSEVCMKCKFGTQRLPQRGHCRLALAQVCVFNFMGQEVCRRAEGCSRSCLNSSGRINAVFLLLPPCLVCARVCMCVCMFVHHVRPVLALECYAHQQMSTRGALTMSTPGL